MPVEGFKVDVDKAVGHVFESEKVVCNRRDFLLYALGVGVKEDELKYLYELGTYWPCVCVSLGCIVLNFNWVY